MEIKKRTKRKRSTPPYVPFTCPYCAVMVKIKLFEFHKLRACVDRKAAELYGKLESGEIREAHPWQDNMRRHMHSTQSGPRLVQGGRPESKK